MNKEQLREVATYYEDVWLMKMENGASDGCVHYGLHIDGMSTKPKINTNRLIENTLNREMPDESDHVMDLGCGVGGTLAHLNKGPNRWKLYGMTSSIKEKRVSQVIHRTKPNVWVGDYHENWDTKWEFFGGIYAIESLCQSWDRQAVLAEVWRSLVPGGVFLVLDAMLEGDVPDDGADPGEKSLRDMYDDVRVGFHVPDLYEVPLMEELVTAGFEVEQELDFTPNVAESIFDSAGRAIYRDGTNCIPLRKQLHGLACVGMAALLAHKKLRYTLTIARKPIDADTQA